MPNWSNAGEGRRRSQRVILSIPVTVSGETDKGTFSEQTQTLVINAHGALVSLSAKLAMGSKLQLKSATSPQPQDCTVVYVGPQVDSRTQFGLEFTAPNPYFWQIAFPPQDWSFVASDETPQTVSPATATVGAPEPQKTVVK